MTYTTDNLSGVVELEEISVAKVFEFDRGVLCLPAQCSPRLSRRRLQGHIRRRRILLGICQN